MIPLLGKTLNNRYLIEEHIGRGGMAEVYRAYDQQRGVYLALKVLREDLAEDKVFLRRFEREAKTLAMLQHPNIVRFYGFERSDGYVYMLMEYVEGETLRKMIAEKDIPMSEGETLAILDPVCKALNYAHQMGRIHCDVKSANILIQKDGHVYLTDFGIARGMDMATSTMVGVGTPAYMAPELIKGQDPTPQTDIYALGIVLYEMLTGGERPFTGERATITGTTADKVRWEHLQLKPTPIEKYNSQVNLQEEEVIWSCLNKDPRERYDSTMELLDDLKNTIKMQSRKEGPRKIDKAIQERKPVEQELLTKKEPLKRLEIWGIVIVVSMAFGLITGISKVSKNARNRMAQVADEGITLTENGKLQNYQITSESITTPSVIINNSESEMLNQNDLLVRKDVDKKEQLSLVRKDVDKKEQLSLYSSFLSNQEFQEIIANTGKVKINDKPFGAVSSYGDYEYYEGNFILDVLIINPTDANFLFDYGIRFRNDYFLVIVPQEEYCVIFNKKTDEDLFTSDLQVINKGSLGRNRIVLIVYDTFGKLFINNNLIGSFAIDPEFEGTQKAGLITQIFCDNYPNYQYVSYEKLKILELIK